MPRVPQAPEAPIARGPLRVIAFQPRLAANGLQLSELTRPLAFGGCVSVKQESVEYYRQRARAECEAALNATCPEARRAHAAMAEAYERLVEVAKAEGRSALAQLGEGSDQDREAPRPVS